MPYQHDRGGDPLLVLFESGRASLLADEARALLLRIACGPLNVGCGMAGRL